MSKIIITIISLVYISSAYAQIGINTGNPQHLFHIDGASSVATTNPSTGVVSVAQGIDDVVITNTGNMGIGIAANPDSRLHVAGQIKMVHGTLTNGSVLLSDDDEGAAKWGAHRVEYVVTDYVSSTAELVAYGTENPVNSGFSIDFQKAGTYYVSLGARLELPATTTSADYLLMQFIPREDPSLWGSADRVHGSFEIYGTAARRNQEGSPCLDWRFYFNESITVTEDNTKVFLYYTIRGTFIDKSIVSFSIGTPSAGMPVTGGSYLKIN